MSVAVVLGPSLGALAADLEDEGAAVRVRGSNETAAERANALRGLLGAGAGSVLLVDRAFPVRSDWASSGAVFALVSDHIDLTGDNPLVGGNAAEWGPRFPDLTDAWGVSLRRGVRSAALETGVEALEGVVAVTTGDARTAAELGMLRMIGADMASSGFAAEAIVARHAGRRVAGLAVLATGTELPGEARAIRDMAAAALSAVAAAPGEDASTGTDA